MSLLPEIKRIVSVAPMMDCTDRHFRYLLRTISRHCLLYTEMVTTAAIIHGNREQLLAYHVSEHPLALQLGGSEPGELALCAKIAEDLAYDEVNLNVGCPSSRVQKGRFGACLMKEPQLVADCVAAMRTAVQIPVTVKTRLGVDEFDSYDYLANFVERVAKAGCQIFIIHARKAWLKGLSPRENREIPPLCYASAYQLKKDFPQLTIIINGGIKNIQQINEHCQQVDGAMLGREVYRNPYLLAEIDKVFYGELSAPRSRQQCLEYYLPYVQAQLAQGIRLTQITRHLFGLFYGLPGANAWRRYLSEQAYQADDIEIVRRAAKFIEE